MSDNDTSQFTGTGESLERNGCRKLTGTAQTWLGVAVRSRHRGSGGRNSSVADSCVRRTISDDDDAKTTCSFQVWGPEELVSEIRWRCPVQVGSVRQVRKRAMESVCQVRRLFHCKTLVTKHDTNWRTYYVKLISRHGVNGGGGGLQCWVVKSFV